MSVEFVDELPAPRRHVIKFDRSGTGHWQQLARALADTPGRWARVLSGVPERQAHSAHRRLLAAGCEATRRKTGDDTFDLFARWPEVAA